jgi:hypothetical protein
MSKDIDTSKGYGDLDEDDLLYLSARDDQAAAAELANRGVNTDQSGDRPIEEIANTGDANTAGESIEELEARLQRMRDEQGVEDSDDEGLEPPYDEYKNDDLRSEIIRRNEGREDEDKLSLDGKKDDLVATLEMDDQEDEE